MRKPLIAGNWKMNKSALLAEEFANEILEINLDDQVEALICPPFTAIDRFKKTIGDKIKLGAQNLSEREEGAVTGEISAEMLVDLGCDYVIVGHSERRDYFKESSEIVRLKAEKAIAFGLVPIICVGESLEVREEGRQNEFVNKMLKDSTENLKGEFVVAYEPIWAIGTGKTCSPEDAEAMCKNIRETLKEMGHAADDIRILYGGSVKPSNISGLMSMENIDGSLVGGASLKVEDFVKLVNYKGKI